MVSVAGPRQDCMYARLMSAVAIGSLGDGGSLPLLGEETERIISVTSFGIYLSPFRQIGDQGFELRRLAERAAHGKHAQHPDVFLQRFLEHPAASRRIQQIEP